LLGRLLPNYFPKIFGPGENEALDKDGTKAAFEALANEVIFGLPFLIAWLIKFSFCPFLDFNRLTKSSFIQANNFSADKKQSRRFFFLFQSYGNTLR